MVPKPQQEHDGNYTNTLVQPVHPAKGNIFSAHKITGYTHGGHFLVSHNLVKFVQTCQRNVLPPRSGEMKRVQVGAEVNGSLDRKVGGNFGRSKLWKSEEAKILCCPIGSSEIQKGVNHFMMNDCTKKKAMLS